MMSWLETYREKRHFEKTAEPEGAPPRGHARKSAPGGVFVIHKHAARQIHFDLRLEMDRMFKSWAVPKGPSVDPGDGKEWLLIKERDEFAEPGVDDLWGADDRSVASLRTMKEIAEAPPAMHRRPSATGRPTGARRNGPPQKAALSLATLVDEPPEGDEWLHEIKFDGYRILARVSAGDVTLLTRNGLDWTARFPTLAAELTRLEIDSALLDGEVVADGPDGRSDFGALQTALRESDDAALNYMVFDLLYADGVDTRRLPLAERKARLAHLLRSGLPSGSRLVRVSEHVAGHGATFYAEACRLGLEGVVSKRADASYPGKRSRTWLKSKCGHRQEFVVGGYTDPAGSRAGFGALLLGVHDAGGDLRYAGKVGSGFTDDVLRRLATRLRALARVTPPFDGAVRERGTHWVTPKLVAEVAFSGWTTDGRLRQPVFKGLREDKAASAVRREIAPEAARSKAAATSHLKSAAGSTPARKSASHPKPAASRPKPDAESRSAAVGHSAPDAPGKSKGWVSVAGVRISHPERVVYPDLGMTKLEVVAHYEAVAEPMLPHLTGRPLTVVRCPEGAAEECFFQKHATGSIPDLVARVTVKEGHGTTTYPDVTSAAALITMVQLGALEFHIWGSREAHLETPDRIVFDLDPAPDVRWADVRTAALRLRDDLSGRGLESLLMTSGGKGLHVVVPLRPEADWSAIKGFARDVVEDLVRRYPQKYVASMSKAKRSGKVFVDHFRNGRGATAIAPYSLRARDGAPVATPLTWDELGKTAGGGVWTAPRVLRRLRSRPDPWAGADQLGRQRLPDAYR
jgi:bifunctional non-homologous end joining protein LigD